MTLPIAEIIRNSHYIEIAHELYNNHEYRNLMEKMIRKDFDIFLNYWLMNYDFDLLDENETHGYVGLRMEMKKEGFSNRIIILIQSKGTTSEKYGRWGFQEFILFSFSDILEEERSILWEKWF